MTIVVDEVWGTDLEEKIFFSVRIHRSQSPKLCAIFYFIIGRCLLFFLQPFRNPHCLKWNLKGKPQTIPSACESHFVWVIRCTKENYYGTGYPGSRKAFFAQVPNSDNSLVYSDKKIKRERSRFFLGKI